MKTMTILPPLFFIKLCFLVSLFIDANSELRAQMKKAIVRELAKTTASYSPPAKLTTDNAAMIAAAGYLRTLNKEFIKPKNLEAKGNLGL